MEDGIGSQAGDSGFGKVNYFVETVGGVYVYSGEALFFVVVNPGRGETSFWPGWA